MRTAPGLTQWLPLPYGPFGEFLRDPLGTQLQMRERFGDVFRFRIGPLIVHFLYHPDHVHLILHERQKNYPRSWHYRSLRRLMGNGLVMSEGEYWLRQRRLAQPAFHRQRLAEYANVMALATSAMLQRWQAAEAANQEVDAVKEMHDLALSIAGLTLFSRDPIASADSLGSSFAVLSRELEHRFNHPFTSPPTWFPTPGNRQLHAAIRTLNAIVDEIIADRLRDGCERGDLLSMLMQARDDETGQAMTERELRSEAQTFLVAGHETTATALAWTLDLLATHPHIQDRVRAEASAVLQNCLPTSEDLPSLRYTRMVIEESMRLFPPVWAVARDAAANDEIGGYRIPAGSTILLSPYVTHRHPDFWPRPDEFDPERFAPEQVAARQKCAYFPFLSGLHQCIGNEFAMIEMRIIVAMIVRQFVVSRVAGEEVYPKASLALKPNGPIRLALNRTSAVFQNSATAAAASL